MNIANRMGIPLVVALIGAVLGLTLVVLGSPTHVAAQSGSDPEAYVTVVITSSDDTVSWSDPDECTSDYNTYLKVTSGPGTGTTSRTHIGSVASGSTEATQTITYSWTSDSSRPSGVELELYCGSFDAGSRQNVLIASTDLATRYRALREGTYSSAPLTALGISSGTLSPAFDRGINTYTAEVSYDVEVITLDPTVLTGYQTDFVRNPGWGVLAACGRGCNYSYGNGTTSGIVLADADEETEGFQISLNRGENRLGIGVNKGNNVDAGPGRLYYLTVTVENSPATGQPIINGTAQVGQTLTADTSGISDADGLNNVVYSYQWLSSRDTAISGATGETYTLVSTDLGKIIKVKVTFTDDAGNSATLTSAGTAAVVARANSAGICDRTAQVRETILDQLPNTSDCAAVTDTDLSGIIRLALSEKGITTLKSGDFSGLSNLRHLNLVDNELSALSDGIFDDLTRLQELSLFDNRISRLPDDIFDNLSGLQSLSLSGNGLSELPDGAFDNLSGLQSLGLGDNSLSELPDGAFDNLSGLQSLDLGNNDLSELPGGAFDNLTELQWLDLGNNDLSELPDGIFDNLTRLRTLKLSHNDLSELPDGIFDNLTELEILSLHWNRLSELPDGILGKVTALSSLELSYNELSELPDGLFDDLSELQFLHLSDNELSELPDGAFDSLTTLWSLSVGGNELSALPEDVFVNLAGLQSLDLNNNELSELPDGIFDSLSELHSLHLNGNELSELPDGIFDNLTKLQTLSVDYNGLGELPDSVFDNLSELWGLSLIGNELSELPDGIFDNLANLKQLYLFSNKLSELPDRIFYGLAILDVLNIDENTGSPFTFTVELERPDENTIALKVAQATPFDMEVTLSAEGGSLSSATVTIPAGNVSSEQITVSPNGAEPVAISVVSAAFLLGEFQQARGIQTGLGDHLTLREDSDIDTPATGAPTISGTAQVGETLTADTSDIADADGLSNATFIYQWLGSRDTEIQGATSATYTLVAEDEGKTIKVRVTFTDNAGNNETLTSSPTAVVSAAPPPPPDNVHAVTQKSGVVELTWDAPDGATVTGYGIERRPADGQGSGPQRSNGQPRDHHTLVEDTGSADTGYTDESAEKGVEYEYRVSARNEAGAGESSDWVRAGPESVSNSPATGTPTIAGTAKVGQTLTADTTGIADADGVSGETFTYQWVSGDGTTDTDMEKATASTYKLADADRGKAIKVRVTFTDDGGNEETLTSAPTEPVLGDGLPGTPRNLTATPGDREVTLSWDPPDDNGNAPATRYRIEWRVDGKDYDRWSQWGTSRSTTYTTNDRANLANGVKYYFRVKAENGSGNSYGPASEEVSATPTSGSAVNLGTPVLSDTENLHHRMIRLDWQDIEDAGWYVVQYYHLEDGEWLDLPAEGVDIAFHGSSAVVSNLHGLSWLRVGAASCDGASEWSQIEELYGTDASDWEGVPVPEVEEGDQTEPCPVVLGTPVLSEPEYLHHSMVQLDWEDIEDAGWYVVQHYHLEDGEWLDLPAEGVDIAFHGSSAVVSNLHGLSWLRVGAASCDGESEWSQIEELYGTNASDWEGVPVPEVAEGDEIEPCDEDPDTPDNSPATGAPTINGTAQVGERLTANTSGVIDADGLSNIQYEYQWLADDSEISGATNATYTPVKADEGKAITVQVNFTDDADNEESLASAATDAVAAEPQTNSPATGAPTIDGTVQVGETLTANTSGVADPDGLSNVQYEYQWLADDTDIAGASGLAYTLTDSEESKAITVQVSFTDDADNEEMLTSAATDAVAAEPTPNSPATGAPTITGTVQQVGETLTANTSGIADADGLANATFRYQWLADDTDIAGATGLTYTLVAADEGKAITVQVSFTDDAGNEETLTSAPTDAVAATVPGVPQNLRVLPDSIRSLNVSWEDPTSDGGSAVTWYKVQWKSGEEEYDSSRQRYLRPYWGQSYTIPDLTIGVRYTIRVIAENQVGDGPPSVEVTEAPLSSLDALRRFIEIDVVQAHEASHPWLRTTWEYMQSGFEFEVIYSPPYHTGASVSRSCSGEDGLQKCRADGMEVGYVKITDLAMLAHEMAHVYTLTNGLVEEPAPLGVAHLYFDSLDTRLPGFCQPAELFADIFELSVVGGGVNQGHWDGIITYWEFCNPGYQVGDADPQTLEALTVVNSALRGQMPQWFADTYHDANGNPDLEQLWTDIKSMSSGMDRVTVTYRMRDQFGGYCGDPQVSEFLDVLATQIPSERGSNDKIRNPWRESRCVPEAPDGLSVVPGNNQLELSWDGPAYDGGSQIQGYAVEWKSGDEEYDESRRTVIDDPSSLSHTVTNLTEGVEHTLRVTAFNVFGDGEFSDEITASSIDATPPQPLSASVHHAALTLSYNENLDTVSVPATSTFDVSVAGSEVEASGVTVVGSEVKLTLASAVEQTDEVKLGYSVPANAEAPRIQDPAGNAAPSFSQMEVTNTTPESSNTPATGAPAISGTVQVGETLTANTSGIADSDGLSNVQYEYQWLADDVDIAGATGSTYTLTDSEESKAIKVAVSFTDDADNEETLTSAATPVVAAVPVHAKSAPDLEVGTPSVDDASPFAGLRFTLSVTVTNAGDGASEATRLRYYRSTDSTITSSDTEQGSESVGALAAAGTSDHDGGMTVPSEAGTYYYGACVDSVTNESDTTDNCSSSVTLTVSEPAPDLVVIGINASDNIVTGGSFQVGVTVTNQGDAQSAETTLRWKQLVDGTTTEIGTAAQPALTRPQSSFKTIWLTAPSTPGTSSYWACVDSVAGESDTTNNCSGKVTVTVTNNLATGAPTISGTAQVGETLTADVADIADADGLANATFSYQWLADDTDIAGATGLTYTLTDSEESKAIKVRVSFTDDAGNEETLTSAATAVVAGAQPTEPPDKPRNLSATATHDSVTLTWDDPGDDTITGYVILRRIPGVDPQGHFDELVANTGTAATTYTDDEVAAETRYTYRIKAINGAGTSERSRWYHIDVPAAPVPDRPTGLEATVTHGQVTLRWDDPGDDSITGYVILRRVRVNNTGGDFSVLVADTASAATTYTDAVATSTTYTYRIKAINEHGVSERSSWFHIDIPEAP